MERKRIVYWVLALIPTLFVLFLLAMINVLLMLLSIIALLAGLLFLKKKRPGWFATRKEPEPPRASMPSWNSEPPSVKPKVYMVLAGREHGSMQRLQVNKTLYSIGREDDNDFRMESGKVGRHHLRIEYDEMEDVCYAIDNGSVNGTFLNSERMAPGERYRLIQGDRLRIDDREFEVDYANY